MIIKGFIVFEGIDGAGTTTQLNKLKEIFKDELCITTEPTEKETGLFLRRMLKADFKVSPKTASYLFAADRCEHIYGEGGVLETTEHGKIVISDRYLFSSLAYQSVDSNDNLPWILNSPFPLPELLFYFKINPEVSLKRVQKRGEGLEIYEEIEFQKKVAKIFDHVINQFETTAKGNGMKIITIDAEKPIDEITQIILAEIRRVRKP